RRQPARVPRPATLTATAALGNGPGNGPTVRQSPQPNRCWNRRRRLASGRRRGEERQPDTAVLVRSASPGGSIPRLPHSNQRPPPALLLPERAAPATRWWSAGPGTEALLTAGPQTEGA